MIDFELNALYAAGNGETLPRPVRRRLEKQGLVKGSELTALGVQFTIDNAPSSRWSPPKQQGPQQHRSMQPTGSRLVALALVLSINPR